MSAETPKKALSVTDFLSLFSALAEEGIESVVIGGCAVGVYARLIDETIVSGDLDLFAGHRLIDTIIHRTVARGARLRKRPRPRSIQVTVLDWEGKEVNVLSATPGLPSPEDEARVAREFHLPGRPELPILVADPFDLLANKLAVNRAKDRPHIAVLTRFIEEEIVDAFEREEDPRKRLAPAQRLLRILKSRTLDERLAVRLIALARLPPDYRFLMNHVPTHELADALAARVSDDALREEIRSIRARRRLRH